jgi:hypothetical protein
MSTIREIDGVNVRSVKSIVSKHLGLVLRDAPRIPGIRPSSFGGKAWQSIATLGAHRVP